MRYRTMGRTGVQVSVIGLGGNMFGNPVDEAGLVRILDRATELGINFLDTAESYGPFVSETLLGKALRGRRDDFVLATKLRPRSAGQGLERGGGLSRRNIAQHLDASLARLATDHVDIYYFHQPDPLTPVEESLRAIDDQVRAGKIRYLGISNFAGWQVAEAAGLAAARGWTAPAVEQSAYSLLRREVEAEVLPACEHFGVSFVPYAPLAAGFLTGKYPRGAAPAATTRLGRRAPLAAELLTAENYAALDRYAAFAAAHGRTVGELALAWLASHPAVCSVIAGATSPEQVAENAKAAEWVLTPEERSAL